MKKGVALILLVLLLLIKPVLGAELLELNDLTVTVEGKKDCYSPDDKLIVTIRIEPKDEEAAKKMENREYTILIFSVQKRKTY